MATKSEKILAWRPENGSIPPIKTKTLQASLLRIAPIAEFEPSTARLLWIVCGVVLLFGLLIGANYWVSERRFASVSSEVARPIDASVRPPTFIKPSSMERAPQLSFGLWPPSHQAEPEEMAAQIAAEPPGSAPSQHEPRYITVAEGQSLSRIARTTHLPARLIAAINHLEPPYRLQAGAQLLIPDPADQDVQASSGTTLRVPPNAVPSTLP